MKHFISILIVLFFSLNCFAQNSDIKTDTFKVEGNCNMCKKRIEDASYVRGVKRAEWDKHTKELIVVYRSSKTNPETILKQIAKAGHSSEQITATEKDYKRLPQCCQYKTHDCND